MKLIKNLKVDDLLIYTRYYPGVMYEQTSLFIDLVTYLLGQKIRLNPFTTLYHSGKSCTFGTTLPGTYILIPTTQNNK